jgi:hypothetical protein
MPSPLCATLKVKPILDRLPSKLHWTWQDRMTKKRKQWPEGGGGRAGVSHHDNQFRLSSWLRDFKK